MRELRHNELSYLDRVNAHPRDFYVFFEEGPNIHRYHINGDTTGVISGTEFLHRVFPHFDGQKISANKLAKEGWLREPKYGYVADVWKPYFPPSPSNIRETALYNEWRASTNDPSKVVEYIRWRIRQIDWQFTPLFKEMQAVVLKNWEDNRDDAARRGTATHLNNERYLNHLPYENESLEWKLFESFIKARPWLKIWRTEMRIWSKQHLLAGSIDAIFIDTRTGKYYVYDWKRSKEIKFEGWCRCEPGQHSSAVCDGFGCAEATKDVPNCNYYHYSLQVWLYATILELHYGIKIEGCFLVILHPDQKDFIELAAVDLRPVVKAMMEKRALEVIPTLQLRRANKRAREQPPLSPRKSKRVAERDESPERK